MRWKNVAIAAGVGLALGSGGAAAAFFVGKLALGWCIGMALGTSAVIAGGVVVKEKCCNANIDVPDLNTNLVDNDLEDSNDVANSSSASICFRLCCDSAPTFDPLPNGPVVTASGDKPGQPQNGNNSLYASQNSSSDIIPIPGSTVTSTDLPPTNHHSASTELSTSHKKPTPKLGDSVSQSGEVLSSGMQQFQSPVMAPGRARAVTAAAAVGAMQPPNLGGRKGSDVPVAPTILHTPGSVHSMPPVSSSAPKFGVGSVQ